MSNGRSKSIPELAAVRVPAERYDVAILGGGLAGLTLAIQLKRQRPETSMLVLEKRARARRRWPHSRSVSRRCVAARTISTRSSAWVTISSASSSSSAACASSSRGMAETSLGGSSSDPHLPARTRIFRSIAVLFENELAARARKLGVDVAQGSRVREVVLGGDAHRVTFEQFGSEAATSARWVVDATGEPRCSSASWARGRLRASHQRLVSPRRRIRS